MHGELEPIGCFDQIDLHRDMRHINLLLTNVVATFVSKPLEHRLKVPDGCTALVNRSGKVCGVHQHQLSHVLTRHSQHIRYIGETYKVRTGLNELCCWNGLLDILQSADNGALRRLGFAGEPQCNSPRLANANQGVITACFTQTLDQVASISVVCRKVKSQFELVFHCSVTPDWGHLSRLFDPLPRRAIVNHALELPRMAARIRWGTPNASDAELATAALGIVVRAIKPAPGVAAAHLHAPAVGFGIPNCLFDFLLRMSISSHSAHSQTILSPIGCQVTTRLSDAPHRRHHPPRTRSRPTAWVCRQYQVRGGRAPGPSVEHHDQLGHGDRPARWRY